MVATSLSEPERRPELEGAEDHAPDPNASIVDPNNERIVTTGEERRLFDIACDILPGENLQSRDTESYFSVTHAGRSNRWLFRFRGDKRRPTLQFIEPITDAHRAEATRAGLEIGAGGHIILDKPENLYRLAGMLRDALAFCKNDDNFRRGARNSSDGVDDDPM
ncbi:MAG: hypothetical protein AB7E55_17640 [Pigmentiphaga sp.]